MTEFWLTIYLFFGALTMVLSFDLLWDDWSRGEKFGRRCFLVFVFWWAWLLFLATFIIQALIWRFCNR